MPKQKSYGFSKPPNKRKKPLEQGQSSEPSQEHAQTPAPRADSLVGKYVTSNIQYQNFRANFATRDIDKPMVLDYEWFSEQPGFHFLDKLAALNLIDFMKFKGPCYEEPVKAFYANLKFREDDGVLVSEVKGVKMEMTLELFGNIVGLPSDGDICLGFRPPEHWTEFNSDRVLGCFRHLDADFHKRVLAQSLTVQNRLIHYSIVHILIPKYGNYAQVNQDQILLMWIIKTQRRVNWAHLVAYHMYEAHRKNGSNLPYALHITKILEHFNVPLQQEVKIPITKSHTLFTAVSINRMSMLQEDGVWVYSNLGSVSNEEWTPNMSFEDLERRLKEAHDSDIRRTQARHARGRQSANRDVRGNEATSSSSADPLERVLTALQEMRVEMREMGRGLGQRFGTVETRLTAVETGLTDLQRHLGSSSHVDSVAPNDMPAAPGDGFFDC